MHFSYLKTSDDASNIRGGSRIGRGGGTSSSRTETAKYVTFSLYFEHVHTHILHWIFTDACSLHFFEVMVPLILEEEDHQLAEAEAEAEVEEEVVQGLLLCSM
jgi:hypothetical protein